MSTLKVDSLVEKTSGNGVHIAGHVVQVVNTQDGQSSWISTSSQTYVNSGISLSITPTSSSSIIELDFRAYMAHGDRVLMTIYRDSTDLATGTYTFGFNGTSTGYESATALWHDQPSTTSPITYKIYYRSGSGNTAHLVHNDSGYTFTAKEIAQ